ncbi:MAG: hypothetical protein NC433_07160 [Clostridiales bacterium]|nr:hypothetical protein [Clostridiales bacterium]
MEINRIEGQTYHENTGSAKAKREKKGSFYENLSENLNGRNSQKTNVNTTNAVAANTAINATAANTASAASASAAVNKAYRYHNISSAAGRAASGHIIADGVYESAAKNISYEESDYVKVCMESGYTLMAQVDMKSGSVYVEQKMEDGAVKGYSVDIDKIDTDKLNVNKTNTNKLNGNGAEPIVNAAYEAWQKAVSADEDKEDSETELSVEEALLGFYEFIEDRIKNGPPKYLIGGSEFSVEEWDKFLESIDGQIDDIKEEVKKLIEEMKAQQQKEKQEETQREEQQ